MRYGTGLEGRSRTNAHMSIGVSGTNPRKGTHVLCAPLHIRGPMPNRERSLSVCGTSQKGRSGAHALHSPTSRVRIGHMPSTQRRPVCGGNRTSRCYCSARRDLRRDETKEHCFRAFPIALFIRTLENSKSLCVNVCFKTDVLK